METPLRIEVPCRILICGATGVGKSHLTANLIIQRQRMFSDAFKNIFYCCKDESSIPPQIRLLVKFVRGLPDEEITNNIDGRHILLIVDDLMTESFKSQKISDIFLSGRHKNLSILLISQVLFPQERHARSISLNCSHLIVFPYTRDQSSIIHLAKQVYPTCPRDFKDMYIHATSEKHSYLMLTFSPNASRITRFAQNIFADCPTVYLNHDEGQKVADSEASPIEL